MKTFRNRVFILILIPTLLIFLAIILTGSFYFNSVLKQQAISKKQSELELASRAVDDWLISRFSDLVLLSRIHSFSDSESTKIKKLLIEEQNRLSFLYEKFWIMTPEGEFWNTEGETGSIEGHRILDSFTYDIKFLSFYIPLPHDKVFGKSIVLGVSMYNGDTLTRILCASIPFEWFNRVIRYFTTFFFTEAYVADPSGVIVSHSTNSFIGKKEIDVYDRVFTVNTEFKDSHAFVKSLRSKWKMVGMVKNQELYQQINKTNQYVTVLIVSFLAVIALVSFGITRIVENPIRILTEGVKRVMRGDYGQKIVVNSTNELNTLADTFNKMNQKLTKSRTDDRFVFLGHISARMAHEIRKPMNIIQLIAESVRKRGEFREDDYQAIVKEVENADRFIKEIYEFVKPEDLSLSSYSLRKLIVRVIEKYELTLSKANIQIITELEEGLPEMYIDLFRIEQVISNIILNSIQAIGENGLISVYLAQAYDSNKIILKIMDSGPGIPETILDKIFDPYFSTKPDGIGIGLSISYRILMSHGAKIEAFNPEKGGAAIQITFMNIE